MSSARLLCRLAATRFAQVAWVDVAAALWRSGDGRARVAVGYSGTQPTGQAATNSALRQCQSSGGQGCRNLGPVRGCAYIVVGNYEGGVAYGAGASPEDAIASVKSAGATSWNRVIGGCGQ
jgi:hypothetical protein